MIKISEIALDVLFQGLKASHISQERGLRIKEEGNRLTLELDIPKAQDRVISHNGQKVLIIDPGFESSIGDAFIDIEETEEGTEIIMRSGK